MKHYESLLKLKERINSLTLKLVLMPGDRGTENARETQYNKYYLYMKQRGRCCFCQRRCFADSQHFVHKKEIATIEHKIPKSKGGENSLKNYAMSCWDCNNLRGSIPFERFMTKQDRYKELRHLAATKNERIKARREARSNELSTRIRTDAEYLEKVRAVYNERPGKAREKILSMYQISAQELFTISPGVL